MNARISNPFATPQAHLDRPLVRIVIVGHVDHGKSTLIGRLLHETGGIAEAKLEQLKAISKRRGMPFEWAFLLDALQTERDQGITIDTSQIRFRTPSRDIVLIDAPGHTEFLRNMITGAAQADAALLLIDAAEGVREQTRRHGYLLHLLGIRQTAVVVNKMDRVQFAQDRFQEIAAEISAHLHGLGLKPAAIIPISARGGDGVTQKTAPLSWHQGPTVIEALDHFEPARPTDELPLRFPVQAIYKFDDRRIIAGRIESGRIAVGDPVAVTPSGKVARVRAIEAWPSGGTGSPPQAAYAGQSIGITLDREIFLDRGDIVSAATQRPRALHRIDARVFWLHEQPLDAGTFLTVRIGTAEARATVMAVTKAVDPGQIESTAVRRIAQNHVGEITLSLAKPLAADPYSRNPRTGRLVLDLDGRIAGGGLILDHESAALEAPAGRESGTMTASALTDHDNLQADAARLAARLTNLTLPERLRQLRHDIEGRIVFTTSFGLEDQVIAHFLCEQNLSVDLVTLDTGRLFPETYQLWARTERRYGRRIRAIYPDAGDLEALVERHGIDGFYDSREARTACCHVRKVLPLNRALQGARVWVTGLRADQSQARSGAALASVDEARQILKVSPLVDLSRDQLLAIARAHDIPLNPLHEKGFVSIGCAPCTRAIRLGEPERAGRWWWEDENKKECGLHLPASAAHATAAR